MIGDGSLSGGEAFEGLNHAAELGTGDAKEVLCGEDYGELTGQYLLKQTSIEATLVNPRFITGIDAETLEGFKENHRLVLTLEDGVLDGGFGEKIARYYGPSEMKVLNFGAKKAFTDQVLLENEYRENHLTKEQIVEDIRNVLHI